ncbi:MAG: NAD(P)H-dependent oxidoreductase subunit E [Acidobacteria bacterium]|nr:MAG: NAD(P)H-dependent oxidoreductase subunit E [Acidobacteriota bacterium]
MPTPFSQGLEQKFADLMGRYPARRSALVPMLMYAQDELGYLTPAAIARIAELLGESEMAVREVIGYYSMLRTEKAGKYHVQVCTNISCLLRGGEELYEHCQKRLGIGNKQTAADGVFSLEEVECLGACSWAPAVQINYDFHQELTPERLDQILDAYRERAVQGA